ncbi:hypothetical protein NIES3585_40620 [Nodularia sp. NIES-3585]|nr:hypothetical protein NIES3585_40620 [Nodularia sp. NIES-3585]
MNKYPYKLSVLSLPRNLFISCSIHIFQPMRATVANTT